MKSRRYLIGGTIVAVAFGALLFKAFGAFGSYSLTVSEFKEMQRSLGTSVSEAKETQPTVDDSELTVHGWAADDKNGETGASKPGLLITDGKADLPAIYKGTLAPSIAPGSEVVLRGKFENGLFRASSVKATKEVRVEGPLAPDAEVQYDVATRTTRFTITDKEDAAVPRQRLAVSYTGAVPDTFFIDVKKVDVSMVVIGRQGPNGVFIASQILTKCASRYEAATPTPTPAATAD